MLGETELDALDNISNQYGGFKTVLSGAKTQMFSSLSSSVQTPDINSVKDGVTSIFNPSSFSGAMNVDQVMDNVVGGFASNFNKAQSFQIKIDNSKINGKDSGGGLLKQLLRLIMSIVEMPKRFTYLFKSLKGATTSLAVGASGIFKSIKLGAKDIYLLFIAIGNIIVKYFLCILSFIITTIGGCFLVHPITLFFTVLYLFAMYLADLMRQATGVDITQLIDNVADYIKWPNAINMVCYSCFGKKVKLRDILTDVRVVEDVGNKISHDFNNVMPRYMQPAKSPGRIALKDLDKAIK
jgi:hypothetical protein